MKATAQVVGRIEHAPRNRFSPEIGRATVDFGKGALVLLTRDPSMIERLSEIGTGSTVEVKGELVEAVWPIGRGGKRREMRLHPTSLRLIHDARKERMLGVQRL